MSLELPRHLLGDRLSVSLILGCGLAVEAAAWRHPGLPVGIGALLAALLGTWHLVRARRAPVHAEWGPGGWRLKLADGRWVEATLVAGTRLLGSSVVLRWHADGRTVGAWLTPADLPRSRLRRLAVRLQAQAMRVGP
jgi:hypothetical protein